MWRRVPCERQLNMGQSVLRDSEKSDTHSRIKISVMSLIAMWCFSKGNWVNIPKPRQGNSSLRANAVTQICSEMLPLVLGRVLFSL